MSKEKWHIGYQEVKNVIHNDIGITKEEVLDVFRQIAKDEVRKIVAEKSEFIYQTLREVLKNEMMNAVNDHAYPKVRANLWNYTNDNSFKDFITGVMKEEIMNELRNQFELNFDITKKQSGGKEDVI